jgi:hypothetical protein
MLKAGFGVVDLLQLGHLVTLEATLPPAMARMGKVQRSMLAPLLQKDTKRS